MLGSFMSLLGSTSENWNRRAAKRYRNSAVWSGISYLARQVTGDPRVIIQRQVVDKGGKTEWNEIVASPFIETLNVCLVHSLEQLLWGAIISLVCCGNGYWLKIRAGAGVIGYVYLPHMLVRARNDIPFGGLAADGSNPITCFEYSNPDGTILRFAVQDVVHFKWGMDLDCTGLGISPIDPVLKEVVTDDTAATLGISLLDNAGITGVWISPKDSIKGISKEQEAKVANVLKRNSTGDMAGTPTFAPFPADLTVIGHSPDKMVLSATRALAASRVLSPLGIDPMVVGFPSENKTYSNFEEACRAAWRSGVKPILRLIARTLNAQALPDFVAVGGSVRVWWDLSEVPEEQEDINLEAERLRKLWISDVIQRSEARNGLGYASEADDDVYYTEWKSKFAPKVDPNADPNAKPAADKPKRIIEQMIEAQRALREL